MSPDKERFGMTQENTLPVWDLPVRIFHWSLVASFTVAYLTAEEENIWHIYSGYAVLGLVVFRLLWGFIGTRHARFSDFVCPPTQVLEYIQGLISRKPERYTGHNPAGGWMILALLASLSLVTISGLKLYAIEEGLGPLAGIGAELRVVGNAHANGDEAEEEEDQQEEFWEEIHELSTDLTLLLILLHVAGVAVMSRLQNENLVKSMFTGRKTLKDSRRNETGETPP